MQAGDILLFKGERNNLVDLGIMHATHSSLTHVAVAIDADTIVEALPPKIHHVHNPYVGNERVVMVTPSYSSAESRDAAVAKALTFVGDAYDVIGIAQLLMFELTTGANRDAVMALLQRWSSVPAMWCSELVALCLAAGGLTVPTQSFVSTPADIGQFLGYREPALMPEGMSKLAWSNMSAPSFRNTQVSTQE